jgi:outer membrane protein OmpA-like peptidoglycan-associated protein
VIEKTYFLKKIQKGYAMTLSNVNFYFNSTYLKEHSYPILDSVANFILANPHVELEVAGHTDDEGPAEYNLTLSEGRAQAIAKYLTSRGIDPSQLIARGYGEEKPIDTGITKAAKARNRRVELIVIEEERSTPKEGSPEKY